MAQQRRQAPGPGKEDPYEQHQAQQHPQGPPPHLQQQQQQQPPPLSRPPSIVHQPSQAPPQQQPPPPPQYSSAHQIAPVYQPQPQPSSGQTQDIYNYQSSPYNTPAATSGYTSAEMMAATMSRQPYPPMSYHTPQSNSPASVGSAAGHEQQRSMYGQPPPQLHQQSMYYSQQPQYQSMPPTAAPSPYGQHVQPPHQSMAPQSNMMMSHSAPSPVQHQMAQHASQHSPVSVMAGSPRHTKIEIQNMAPQLSRPPPPTIPSPLSMGQPMSQVQAQNLQSLQAQSMQVQGLQSRQPPTSLQQQQQQQQQQILPPHQQQHPQHQPHPPHPQHQQHNPQQNGSPLPTSQAGGVSGNSAVNPNAAPGPIPATTPLVVRQDQNGVQWIAFEYSRDRVKMEYTIRCDVESVSTDDLSGEFKQENCVYPRACCPREQYRGNRLQYESECNTVGWALAQLNPPLRGKRGLIQRAVDSWRNSNQDPRLRSRRVRRMAKMGTRKAANNVAAGVGQPSPAHLGAPLPSVGTPLVKPMPSLPPQMHHHPDGTGQPGDEVVPGDNSADPYDDGHPTSDAQDSRPAQVFSSYHYPGGTANPLPPMSSSVALAHKALDGSSSGGGGALASSKKVVPQPDGLFPELPEAKKRKFVLVEDRGSRLRVRVTLNMVNTSEIPDSFRRSNAVYPGSFFPREMESPPPSPTGRRFFSNDLDDDDDAVDGSLRLDKEDDGDEVEAGSGGSGHQRPHYRQSQALSSSARGSGGDSYETSGTTMVTVPVLSGSGSGSSSSTEIEVAVPRMRKSLRRKQVRLNDLSCRMAWLQSRSFAGRRIFLQKALDTYRSKTCNGILAAMREVGDIAPHYEMRVGKKRWLSCERDMELRQLSRT